MALPGDYIPFFNLKSQPFRLSPDPDFFFPARPHVAVLQVLKFAIERGEGFMVLTGHAGTGKTLLLRLLLQELPGEKLPAVVVTPAVTPEGLVALLLEDLGKGVEHTGLDMAILLKRFQDALLELAATGRELLVVVDEAQDLPRDTLEQLRLLSNIELDNRKIIQILLLGQTELNDVLSDPSLGQLNQRIVINETLLPLSPEETREYINFRLARAGRADLEISPGVVSLIHGATGGVPRMINRLMDRALLMAAARGRQSVRKEDVSEAEKTLPAPTPAPWHGAGGDKARPAWRSPRVIAALAIAALGMVSAAAFWHVTPGREWVSRVVSVFYQPEGNRQGQENTVQGEGVAAEPEAAGVIAAGPLPAGTAGEGEAASPEPAADTAPASPAADAARQVMVVVNRALVRSGPGGRFEFITTASYGDILPMKGRDGQWIMVEIWNASGRRANGWIYGKLVREIPSDRRGR